jgi:hypothetical protein
LLRRAVVAGSQCANTKSDGQRGRKFHVYIP